MILLRCICWHINDLVLHMQCYGIIVSCNSSHFPSILLLIANLSRVYYLDWASGEWAVFVFAYMHILTRFMLGRRAFSANNLVRYILIYFQSIVVLIANYWWLNRPDWSSGEWVPPEFTDVHMLTSYVIVQRRSAIPSLWVANWCITCSYSC